MTGMSDREPMYYVATKQDGFRARAGILELEETYFWFAVVDAAGEFVVGGGADRELRHIEDLLDASWLHIDWFASQDVIDYLRKAAIRKRRGEYVQLLHIFA